MCAVMQDTLWIITGLPYSGKEELAFQKGKGKPVVINSFFAPKNKSKAVTALESGCNAILLGGSCGCTDFRRTLAYDAHIYGYKTICCFVRSHSQECAKRAALSDNPEKGMRQIMRESAMLDIPDCSEGFDQLLYVKQLYGQFIYEKWDDGDEI